MRMLSHFAKCDNFAQSATTIPKVRQCHFADLQRNNLIHPKKACNSRKRPVILKKGRCDSPQGRSNDKKREVYQSKRVAKQSKWVAKQSNKEGVAEQQGRSDQSENYKLSLKAPGVSPVNCLKMRWNVLRSLKPESKPMASIVRSSFPASDIRRIASFTRYSFT